MSPDERMKVEELVKTVCADLPEDYKGSQTALNALDKGKIAELKSKGLMLEEPIGPVPMVAAGSAKDWPANRGIFCADKGKFYIWVNEEDHIKAISHQEGTDLKTVFSLL